MLLTVNVIFKMWSLWPCSKSPLSIFQGINGPLIILDTKIETKEMKKRYQKSYPPVLVEFARNVLYRDQIALISRIF